MNNAEVQTLKDELVDEILPDARNAALEEAAQKCDRHAKFLEDEANRGGDGSYLWPRMEEARYNANAIRGLKK